MKMPSLDFLNYPPSSRISSCIRTVYTVMCLHTWHSPTIHSRAGSDSMIISRHELGSLLVGFLFPIGSCSGVRCSVISFVDDMREIPS